MVSIPKFVQEFLPGKLAWVATVSCTGEPNVTPKGSIQAVDENHLLFADLFNMKTVKNLKENNKIAITVIDAATAKGYQFKGTAELITQGQVFTDTENFMKQLSEKVGRQLPPVRHAVKITVEAIFDQSMGPDMGKQIA